MKELIFELCNCNGVSGDENNIAKLCAKKLNKFGKVAIDSNNSVIAVLGNVNAKKTIMLDAHIDQIGFIVTEIDDKGFLKVEKCGGIDNRTLLGSPVIIFGKEEITGIICCMPPHLSDGKEDKAVDNDKLWVDLGLPFEIVNEMVSIGNTGTFCVNSKSLLNDRISLPALDNRAGVAVAIKTCELIYNKDLPYRVVILLSCQEETYAAGAKTKSYEYEPDECICVDVSFANQQGITDSYSNIELGKGPMLCYSSTLNKDMTNKIKEIALNENIPTQIEICAGRTGTNADHISTSKYGVKSTVLSIPQRNMHTQVEIVDIKDVENTAKLIAKYIISGGI